MQAFFFNAALATGGLIIAIYLQMIFLSCIPLLEFIALVLDEWRLTEMTTPVL